MLLEDIPHEKIVSLANQNPNHLRKGGKRLLP